MHTPATTFSGLSPAIGWTSGAIGVLIAAGAVWAFPGWAAMWAIAGLEFAGLKMLTLRGISTGNNLGKKVGYLVLWPGMNAPAFFAPARGMRPAATWTELWAALLKLALGLSFASWATLHVHDARPTLVAWVGMFGIIFTLHFGCLHVLSWMWRRAGVDAPPIMRLPLAATSLSELWGSRWNLAFADAARRHVFRPLARRHGVRFAGATVFLVSGLVHETVTSLPAGGGWGGPTLYFLLQAAGIAAEKSPAGRRVGIGAGRIGWAWTLFVAGAPLPLLFHAPFAHHVIVPFYRALSALSP